MPRKRVWQQMINFEDRQKRSSIHIVRNIQGPKEENQNKGTKEIVKLQFKQFLRWFFEITHWKYTLPTWEIDPEWAIMRQKLVKLLDFQENHQL